MYPVQRVLQRRQLSEAQHVRDLKLDIGFILTFRLPHNVKCDRTECDYIFEDVMPLAKHMKEVHMVGCLLQDKCEACEEVCVHNILHEDCSRHCVSMCRTLNVLIKVMDPGPRFVEHINTAHPFECEHCDLRYVEQEKLKKHKRSHQKVKVKEERHEMVMGHDTKGH